MSLLVPAVQLFGVVFILFIACELPEQTLNKITEINHEISQLNWYLFPSKMKKMLPLFVAVANDVEIVEIKCFGSIPCNRETFKGVSH